MNPQTREHLLTAMHGEAFAYVQDLLFAAQARQNGRPDLAALFEQTASGERLAHFAAAAALVGFAGSDVDNLRSAIQGESAAMTTLYRPFAEAAAAAGDPAAAACFTALDHAAQAQLAALEAALPALEVAASAAAATDAIRRQERRSFDAFNEQAAVQRAARRAASARRVSADTRRWSPPGSGTNAADDMSENDSSGG